MCSASACRPTHARWKDPTTTWSASSARAVAGRGCSARSAAMSALRCRAAIRSASMTATPIWPPRWRAGRGGAAQLYGRAACGAWRAVAGVAGLAAAANADACDVPAEPAHEPAAAGVHRLGGGSAGLIARASVEPSPRSAASGITKPALRTPAERGPGSTGMRKSPPHATGHIATHESHRRTGHRNHRHLPPPGTPRDRNRCRRG